MSVNKRCKKRADKDDHCRYRHRSLFSNGGASRQVVHPSEVTLQKAFRRGRPVGPSCQVIRTSQHLSTSSRTFFLSRRGFLPLVRYLYAAFFVLPTRMVTWIFTLWVVTWNAFKYPTTERSKPIRLFFHFYKTRNRLQIFLKNFFNIMKCHEAHFFYY